MNKIKKLMGSLVSLLRDNQAKIVAFVVMLLFFAAPMFAAPDPFSGATSTITGYADS